MDVHKDLMTYVNDAASRCHADAQYLLNEVEGDYADKLNTLESLVLQYKATRALGKLPIKVREAMACFIVNHYADPADLD